MKNPDEFEIPTTPEKEIEMLREDAKDYEVKLLELRYRLEGYKDGVNHVVNLILNRAFFGKH